jgi:minor histocompatibility antigen H13
MSEEISPLAELLGLAVYHFERLKPLLPTYGHLLIAALFPIWIGAHASLSRPSSAAKAPKKDDEKDGNYTDDDGSDDESGSVQKMEGLEPSDALMFPLTAGLTLGGLYLVIKWLEDPAILNKILSYYFSWMGVFFAIAFLRDTFSIVRSFVFPRRYHSGGKIWHAKQSERIFLAQSVNRSEVTTHIRHSPLPGIFGAIPVPKPVLALLWASRHVFYQRLRLRAHIRGLFDVKTFVGLLDLLSGLFALAAVGYFAFVTKPWWLTNFLGFSFSYGALQFMSPSTFWTGSLILGSLFFYDIYFVFFTPLMVTVATKLDVPIKLLFPRPPSPGQESDVQSLAMLGLGDIVIPGMMIGLALRFDLFLYYRQKGIQQAQLQGLSDKTTKPQYQRATGAWGERFWAPAERPQVPEFKPPYSDARSFPKVYFKASVFGYVVGMITTLLAMQYSNHAQPALLYLVPGVLISLWGTAFFRGETSIMWDFSDAEEEDEEGEGEDKKEGSDKEKSDDTAPQEQKNFFARLMSGDLKLFTPGPKDAASKGSQKESGKDLDDKNGNREGDAETDKSKEADSKKQREKDLKGQGGLDLISFSISFPEKTQKKGSPDSAERSATEKDSMVSIPDVGDWNDDEPPLKKRRGTPRKAAMH